MTNGTSGNGVTKYDLLENEINQLREVILELKSDMKDLKNDIKDLKDDFENMRKDLDEIKYDMMKIKDDIDSNKTGINKTWARLSLLTWAVIGMYALMIVVVLWNIVNMLMMPHASGGQLAQQGVQQGMQIGVVKVGEQHDIVNPPGSINPRG